MFFSLFVFSVSSNAENIINRELIEKAASAVQIPDLQLNKVLGYLEKYKAQLQNINYISFVDFRKPSSEKRFHIINTSTGELSSYLVAHGKNSGDLFAENFSNVPNSKMSSLGIYVVGTSYQGSNGLSLFLDGLDPSNSNARDREIVIHPADYVSEKIIQASGRIGRSWGCFAFNPLDYKKFIFNKIRNGSLLLAFR